MCAICGSREIVTVSGRAALAVFPAGFRCAYYFSRWHGPWLHPNRHMARRGLQTAQTPERTATGLAGG